MNDSLIGQTLVELRLRRDKVNNAISVLESLMPQAPAIRKVVKVVQPNTISTGITSIQLKKKNFHQSPLFKKRMSELMKKRWAVRRRAGMNTL